MRPTFKKLEVKDIGSLERLVAENVEGIEPGLKIVDSRLLLGQAAIDLVGLDAKGSLTLIALDFSADEGLLLRVMDAYSWCLEYPDTLRRLYPMAQLSTSRPPFAAPAAAVMPTPPAVPEYQSVTLATESPVTVSPSLVAAVAEPAVDEPVLASPTLQLEAIEASASLPSVDSGTNGCATEPVAAIDQPWVEPEVNAS